MHFNTDSLEGLPEHKYAELSLSSFKSISCFVNGFYPCDCHISRPNGCLYANGLENAKIIKKNWLTGKKTEKIELSECPVPSNIPYSEGVIYVDEFKFSLKYIKTKGKYHSNWQTYDRDDRGVEVIDAYFEREFLNMYEGDDFRLIVKYNNFAFDPYTHVIFMSREGEIIVDANSEKKEWFSFDALMDPSIDSYENSGELVNFEERPYIENLESPKKCNTYLSYEHWTENIVSIIKLDSISVKSHIFVGDDANGEKYKLIY